MAQGNIFTSQTSYALDHFSGSQISIFFKDIFIEEANAIQFTVTQSKRPIYGYGSQYWHTLADGQVLVEGSFNINFKEANYIVETLNAIKKSTKNPLKKNNNQKEEIIKRTIDNYLRDENDAIYDYLYKEVANMSLEEFEQAASTFEDALWTPSTDNVRQGNVKSSTTAIPETYRRADQWPIFDIYVVYGDFNSIGSNHTAKKIVDVSIVGTGQQIMVSGEPIQESYSFIARDLI